MTMIEGGNPEGTAGHWTGVEPSPADTNRATIEQQAANALAANRTYVASTPTAAQVAAQSKTLSRQVNGIIRLLLQQLDGTV